MNITLVYKADAGAGDFDVSSAVRALESDGHRVAVFDKRYSSFSKALAESADMIVVAGGDGTVAEVIRAMPDRRIPLGILPVGTANNIARSFGIEDDIEKILHMLPAMKPRRLDLFHARGAFGSHLLVESAAVGCIAEAQHRVQAIPPGQDKIAAARKAVTETVAQAQPIIVALEMDGRASIRQCLGMEILNIRRIGPALPLLAHADPGDGALDVACVEGRHAFLDWLDDPQTPAPVNSERARQVTLRFPAGTLRLDDEFHEDVSDVSIVPTDDSAAILAPLAQTEH